MKNIKCTLSADLLIILVIVNIFLTFILFSKVQVKISVLEEKVAWTEDEIMKQNKERDKTFYKKITGGK